MTTQRRHRRRSSRFRHVQKILLTPFYIFADTFIGLKDALDQTLLFLGLKKGIRGSHNKDFERAGRESAPRMLKVDSAAAAKLKNMHLEREAESFKAGLREERLLARKSAVAKELRDEMNSEARSVSSGSVVSHLAKMNRKAVTKPEVKPDEPDDESLDK